MKKLILGAIILGLVASLVGKANVVRAGTGMPRVSINTDTCGQATVTFQNPTPRTVSFRYQRDNANSKQMKVPKNSNKNKTFVFNEDSGIHAVWASHKATGRVTVEVESDCEPDLIEESTPSVPVENTFHRDTRCLDSKPANVTWTRHVDNELLWSAMGGNKVEVRFGYTPEALMFSLVTSNDGHELTGVGTDVGWWPGFWQMRTLNGCRNGNWSPVMSGAGSW